MSVKKYVVIEIDCDECSSTYREDFLDSGSKIQVQKQAMRDGWIISGGDASALAVQKGKTMRQIIMPSDVVLHRPTGETWTVCGVDHKAGRLIPCGYPFPTVARIEDCEVIERHYETQYQTEEQIKALRKHGLTSFIDVKSAMFHGLI